MAIYEISLVIERTVTELSNMDECKQVEVVETNESKNSSLAARQ